MRPAVVVALLLSFLAPIASADEQKIFMYVRDGSRDLDRMLVREVGVMRQMLEDAGYAVDIATPRDEVLASETLALTPTVKLAAVRIEDYAGLVLPCMAPAAGHAMPAGVDDLVTAALDRGLPMAASRGSVTSLAKAGALVDRTFAFAGPVSGAERPEFAGGTYIGTGVVRDGTISTAGICPLAAHTLGEPDGTEDLMREFIASLAEAG